MKAEPSWGPRSQCGSSGSKAHPDRVSLTQIDAKSTPGPATAPPRGLAMPRVSPCARAINPVIRSWKLPPSTDEVPEAPGAEVLAPGQSPSKMTGPGILQRQGGRKRAVSHVLHELCLSLRRPTSWVLRIRKRLLCPETKDYSVAGVNQGPLAAF